MKQLFLSLILYLFSNASLAQDIYSQGSSPWCLIRDEIEICNYGTQDICYNVALNEGGYCRENARRAGLRGEAEWCVVDSNGRNCNYLSQEQCFRVAVRSNGGCVYNTELALKESAERKEIAGLMLEQVVESGQQKLADQLREAQLETEAQNEAAAAPGAVGP